MNKKIRVGESIAGSVVVQTPDGWSLLLRCECDATFGCTTWQARNAERDGETLRCSACDPSVLPMPKSATEKRLLSHQTPVAQEAVRLRTVEKLGYQEICRRLNLGHSQVYQLLKKNGAVESRT